MKHALPLLEIETAQNLSQSQGNVTGEGWCVGRNPPLGQSNYYYLSSGLLFLPSSYP
jgi:hypothetical protein